MDYELLDVVFRAIVSLVTLFLITKMLGKKQVSQLSLFDYVIGISIGNFAAEMTINLETDVIHGVLAVVLFGIIAYVISIGTMKSIKLRRFFMGVPTVIIEDGILLEDGLKKVKYDINDFLEQCREMGYFDISQILYAVMETSGNISIIPKSSHKPVTCGDIGVKVKQDKLLSNVIIDGNIMEENLNVFDKDIKWLLKRLEKQDKKLNDILLATLDKSGKLIIYEKSVKKSIDILG